MKILSSFTHPYFAPNAYDFISSVKHKRIISEWDFIIIYLFIYLFVLKHHMACVLVQ